MKKSTSRAFIEHTSALAFAVGLMVATLNISAKAQVMDRPLERPAAAGPLHTAWLYKFLCYDPMPDTAIVERLAAEFGFRPITGAALNGFKPQTETSYLKAWEIDDHERTFKAAVSIAQTDEQLAGIFPDFAGGTSTGCTIVLPGNDDPKEIAAMMEKLLTRKADESYEAGPFNATVWSGQTEANVFLIYHYAPKTGKPGGLLSLVTLAKKQN